MLSEINDSCAAVMAHSVIVCDCVDTPCWAEDITTTQRSELTTRNDVPYPIPLPARLQYTEGNETLKSTLFLSPEQRTNTNIDTSEKTTKNNILNAIVLYILSLKSRVCMCVCLYVCVYVHAQERRSLDSCIPARSLLAKESEKYILCSCRRHSRPTKELLCAHSKTIQLS